MKLLWSFAQKIRAASGGLTHPGQNTFQIGQLFERLSQGLQIPSIAAAVGGKLPILIDGSFRRGSDVLKALALGAQAVLLGRPALWGLAAYGAEGVQNVVELIQSEFARDMAMCGKVNVKALDPSVVRIHRR